MSFGISTGDFLAIIQLAIKVRKDFAGAPDQLKHISDEFRSLLNAIQDVEEFLTSKDISEDQQQKLSDIIDSCQGVIQDTQRTLEKYSPIKLPSGGIRRRTQRAWKQLTWDPGDIQGLRNRILSNVLLLNSFSHSFTRDKLVGLVKGQDQLIRRQEQQHHQKVLDWLTPTDYATQQSDIISRRQAGTGQWLLESPKFQGWLTTKKEALFCPGIPGAGKTVFASIVIDQLCDTFFGNPSIGICYIYCNFRRAEKQTLHDFMASLLKQLAYGQSSPQTIVRSLYDRHQERNTRPSIDVLRKTLYSVARTYSRVFVVVDALDECQKLDGSQSKLISELLSLRATVEANILMTSRIIPEIAARFSDAVRMEIRAHESDIDRYLDGNMSHLPGFVLRDPDLQLKIKEKIIRSVDGMFLLAQLHLHFLRGKRSAKAVRSALGQLVTGSCAYDAAYKEALDRVNSQPSDLKELGLQVLSWITCAKRPLTTFELQHALGVEFDQPYLDEENLPDVQDMVSSCCGLVAIDEQSNIIRLVHYTTQEYLERFQSTWFPDAQSEMTRACVTYISFDAFQNDICLDDSKYAEQLSLYPLYDYASHYWGVHAKLVTTHDNPLKLIKRLLLNRQALTQSCRTLHSGKFRGQAPKGVTVAHGAAHFGLEGLMAQLKTASIDFDAPDENRETPLLWAARNRQVGMVELLVHQGANVNTFDFERKTAPHHAAENKWLTALKALLGKGAELTQDIENMTALHYAVLSGWEEGITALLDAGVSIDIQVRREQFVQTYDSGRRVFKRLDRRPSRVPHLCDAPVPGLTPLHLAALVGNLDMVRYLLRHGADPARKSDQGETPLHLSVGARIYDEHIEDVWAEEGRRIEYLFDIVLISDEEEEYNKVYHHIREKRLAILSELLASPGIQVDTQDINGSSCLHTVHYGRGKYSHEVVDLLLKTGSAKVDLRDRQGMSPLHLACQSGNAASVKTLLDHGSCTMMQDNHGCHALHYAADSGNNETLNAILNHTRDRGRSAVTVRDAEGRIALHHLLSWLPSMEALKSLLVLGADVNTLDNSGNSPLAAFLDSWILPQQAAGFVQLLLDRGAEILVPNFTTGMGLHHILAQSRAPNLEVLRLLAINGLNLQDVDKKGRTILHHAARSGGLTREALEFLLDEVGLTLNANDKLGRSPVSYAEERLHKECTDSFGRWEDILELLLHYSKPIV